MSPSNVGSPALVVVPVWTALLAALYFEILGSNAIGSVGRYDATTSEIVLALTFVALVSMFRRQRTASSSVLIVVLAGLLGLNLLRGLLGDVSAALLSLRETGVFTGLLLLTTLLRRDDAMTLRFQRATIAIGVTLAVLVAMRLALGSNFLRVTPLLDPRPLTSRGAFVIAAASILSLSIVIRRHDWRHRWRDIVIFFSLLTGLILTGQRTAIVSALCGGLFVCLGESGSSRGKRVVTTVVLGFVGLIALIATLIVHGTASVSDLLPASLQGNLALGQTDLSWRYGVWTGFREILAARPWVDRVIGLPAGDQISLVNLTTRTYWEHGLHSMYFELLRNTGVLGLSLYLYLLVIAGWKIARGLARKEGHTALSYATCGGLALLCGLFGFSYDLRAEQGLILGLAFLALRSPSLSSSGQPFDKAQLRRSVPARSPSFPLPIEPRATNLGGPYRTVIPSYDVNLGPTSSEGYVAHPT